MTEAPSPAHSPDVTTEWLDQLYGIAPDGWLTLFSLDRTSGQRHTDWAAAADVAQLATAAARRAPTSCVWFGVATRAQRLADGKRGGAKDCVAIPGLWLDIDIEGPGHKGGFQLAADRPAAHALVDSFPLPPTVVIDSGGGLQAWWLFGELVDLNQQTEDLLASWGATWNRLGDAKGIHVDNVFDPARVMRLPGTTNRKDGLARPVTIVTADWDRRYGLDDLDQHLDAPPAPPQHQAGERHLPYIGPERPGSAYNARHTGGDVLSAHGFTLARQHGGEAHWVRPGKEARDGTSATVYDDGHTTIWSDTCVGMWPKLETNRPYDPFGLYAVMTHGGNFTAARADLLARGYGSTGRVQDLIAPGHDRSGAASGESGAPRPTESGLALAWPTPRPITHTSAPPPPLEAFPDWVRDQIVNVTHQLGCDPVLPAAFALGALSVASLGHITVRIREGEVLVTTGLYIAGAAPPAAAKSPALAIMFAPLRAFETQRMAQAAVLTAEADAARSIAEKQAKKAIEDAASSRDPAAAIRAGQANAAVAAIETPPAGEMITTNITPEKVGGIMQANGECIAIVSDESGVLNVDRYGNKDNGANIDIYLQAFTGEPVVVHRQSAPPIRLTHPRLAIVCGVQPQPFEKAMSSDEFRARGLGARFLTVSTSLLATNTDIDRDVWDHAVGDTYTRRLTELVTQWNSSPPRPTTLDAPARRTYSAWAADLRRREQEGGQLEGESGWVAKMRNSTIRIAALFHLADGRPYDEPIPDATMARAIEVGEWFTLHHLRDVSETPQLARRLLGTLTNLVDHKDTVEGVIPRRSIGRFAAANLRKTEDHEEPLAFLIDHGWVLPVPNTLNIAPSTVDAVAAAKGFRLHPDATRHLATDATEVDAQSPDQAADHGESTSVARVASVAIRPSKTPSPIIFVEGGGTAATRATADDEPPLEDMPADLYDAITDGDEIWPAYLLGDNDLDGAA